LGGYCEALVRKHDYDRYLAALFAPEAARADLFAIYAFNYEIARIGETVRNPMAGQIRFQWWHDALQEIYDGASARTESLKALAAAIARNDLQKDLFEVMLQGRELDLDPAPFHDLSDVESYADATSGSVMKLAARVLGAGDTLDGAAHDAGIAYAIAGILRAIPFHAARSRLVLPAEEMTRAHVSGAEILAGRMNSEIAELISRISEVAWLHYGRVGRTSRRFMPAILPAALAPAFLRRMNRPGFNPFRDSTEIPAYRRQWIIFRAVMRGQI
jgi:phytoene/squalene synthetase